MKIKKIIKLINDECTNAKVVSVKGCDSNSTDHCYSDDHAECQVYSVDICAVKDLAACYYHSQDVCAFELDIGACLNQSEDYT